MSPIGGIKLRYHSAYVTVPSAGTLCAAFAFCLAVGYTLFRSLPEKAECLNAKLKSWTS